MAFKREKRQTKRERKAAAPPRPIPPPRAASAGGSQEQHIHCVACGKHLDPSQFDAPATATTVECLHKSKFAACVACVPLARKLLEDHDRTGEPVKVAPAWH
jgi:hypothetical protein